jgi:hypothetical protein
MKKKEIDIRPLFVMIIGFLLGMVIISLTSCDGQKPKTIKEIRELHQVEVVTYDGCEYIVVGIGNAKWGSHKGNCENPIHKGQHPSPYMLESSELEYYENKNPR